MMEGQCDAQSWRRHTRAAVVVTADATETALSSSSLSSSGLGVTTEETNKWDGGGSGKRRR